MSTSDSVRRAKPVRKFRGDEAGRDQRLCRRCHRVVEGSGVFCRFHNKPISMPTPTADAWAAFEEITEAVRDVMWEKDSRARRGHRQLPRNSPLWARLRMAQRRAEDFLVAE